MPDGIADSESSGSVRPTVRRWFFWIAAPAVLGIVVGILASASPLGRELLGLAMAFSGVAWVLRVASDWFAERAGPQRGVVLLGSILIGTWLVLAVSSPGPLRSLGFGPILTPAPERDPYAIPPPGSGMPLQSLQEPVEPLDLKSLVTQEPASPAWEEPEEAVAPGDRLNVATTTTLTLSSAASVEGTGVVLIASVRGDGRPVRGIMEFYIGANLVARQPLRVQGDSSQAEYRVVGLGPGLYAIGAHYRGSRTFQPSRSEPVPHRVTRR